MLRSSALPSEIDEYEIFSSSHYISFSIFHPFLAQVLSLERKCFNTFFNSFAIRSVPAAFQNVSQNSYPSLPLFFQHLIFNIEEPCFCHRDFLTSFFL